MAKKLKGGEVLRILLFIVVACFITSAVPNVALASIPQYEITSYLNQLPGYKVVKRVKKARVTKYYKAEPNQPRYSKKPNGKYRTYREELRLQGNGIETFLGTVPKKDFTVAANLKHIKPFSLVRIKEKIGNVLVTIFIGRVEDTGQAMIRNPNQFDLFAGEGFQALLVAENWNNYKREFVVEVLEKKRA